MAPIKHCDTKGERCTHGHFSIKVIGGLGGTLSAPLTTLTTTATSATSTPEKTDECRIRVWSKGPIVVLPGATATTGSNDSGSGMSRLWSSNPVDKGLLGGVVHDFNLHRSLC